MRTPAEKRDRAWFCNYHANIVHNTDECTSLKYFLERLVKKGLKTRHLPPRGRQSQVPPGIRETNLPPRHVVDTIIGGSVSHKEVMNLEAPRQAFKLTGTAITFIDDDYPPGKICRNGPLTVTLDITNQDVKKVLIDNGSSVDIIF